MSSRGEEEDYRNVDYRSTELFLDSLPFVVTIRPQKKQIAKVTLVRLYVRYLPSSIPSSILPVHPIIQQYLREIQSTARLPPYEEKKPRYLLHVDPFLNIIQAHDEEVGTYFCGYRHNPPDIRLDPRIHFKDGSEYYATELFDSVVLPFPERRKYDKEALQLIVPYLKRGYYLPHLLRLELDIVRRQLYQQLIVEEEEWHHFYYPRDEGPYLLRWRERLFDDDRRDEVWSLIRLAYRKQLYFDPDTLL